MQVGIMITNGGTHPPEKWAAMTVSQIISISKTATGEAATLARKLELRFLDILEDAHREVQNAEKTALNAVGIDHLRTALNPVPYVEPALDKIVAAAEGTAHEVHFKTDEIKNYLRKTLAQHFGNVMHIERLAIADTQPGNPVAVEYKAKYQNGAVPPT